MRVSLCWELTHWGVGKPNPLNSSLSSGGRAGVREIVWNLGYEDLFRI